MENGVTEERRSKGIKRQLAVDSNGFSITVVRGGSYHSPGVNKYWGTGVLAFCKRRLRQPRLRLLQMTKI